MMNHSRIAALEERATRLANRIDQVKAELSLLRVRLDTHLDMQESRPISPDSAEVEAITADELDDVLADAVNQLSTLSRRQRVEIERLNKRARRHKKWRRATQQRIESAESEWRRAKDRDGEWRATCSKLRAENVVLRARLAELGEKIVPKQP